MSAPPAVRVVEETEGAHSLLHPARLALLAALDAPASASTLAGRLDLPRQRVNYHLRELETHGLVEVVEERKRGSVTERVYRRSGESFALSGRVLGALEVDPERMQDRFSAAYQIALASRTLRELGALDAGARAAEKRLATFALDVEVRFATPAARADFAEELTHCVMELVRRYHDSSVEGGRAFRFCLGGYPRPKEAD